MTTSDDQKNATSPGRCDGAPSVSQQEALNHQLRRVLDNIPDGVARLTLGHRIAFINRGMATILGVDPVESEGKLLGQLGLPEEKTREWGEVLDRALASGQPIEVEAACRGRYYDWRVIPEELMPGAEPTALSISRDVTPFRAAREEKQRRLERVELLEQAGLELARTGLDGQAVLDVIARLASTAIGETCFITLLADEGHSLAGAAVHHPVPTMKTWAHFLLREAPFRAGGLFRPVVDSGEPLNINELPPDFLSTVLGSRHREVAQGYDLYALLAVPMRVNHKIVGVVTLICATPNKPYTLEDQALLQELADRAALSLTTAQLYRDNQRQAEQLRLANQELERRVIQRTEQLAEANRQLQALATHDPLTGLYNRRQFDESLDKELRRSARTGGPTALLMLDIDHFKLYNDHYGHQAGDRALVQVAAALSEYFRRGADVVARYGGEEFVVILPDLSAEQAEERARCALEGIAAKRIPHAWSPISDHITVSAGLVCFHGSPSVTAHWCVSQADAALYESKAAGRNCLTVAPEREP